MIFIYNHCVIEVQQSQRIILGLKGSVPSQKGKQNPSYKTTSFEIFLQVFAQNYVSRRDDDDDDECGCGNDEDYDNEDDTQ